MTILSGWHTTPARRRLPVPGCFPHRRYPMMTGSVLIIVADVCFPCLRRQLANVEDRFAGGLPVGRSYKRVLVRRDLSAGTGTDWQVRVLMIVPVTTRMPLPVAAWQCHRDCQWQCHWQCLRLPVPITVTPRVRVRLVSPRSESSQHASQALFSYDGGHHVSLRRTSSGTDASPGPLTPVSLDKLIRPSLNEGSWDARGEVLVTARATHTTVSPDCHRISHSDTRNSVTSTTQTTRRPASVHKLTR